MVVSIPGYSKAMGDAYREIFMNGKYRFIRSRERDTAAPDGGEYTLADRHELLLSWKDYNDPNKEFRFTGLRVL